MRSLALKFLFLFVCLPSISQNLDLKDYKQELFWFDQNASVWKPLTPNNNSKDITTIGFNIPSEDRHYIVSLNLAKGSSIFIENELIFSNEDNEAVNFAIDSLMNLYSVQDLFMVVYNRQFSNLDFSAHLIRKEVLEDRSKGLSILLRKKESFKNFFNASILVLLSLFALLYYIYPKHFSEFYNFKRLSSIKVKEQNILTAKPLNQVNLLFLIAHALLASLVILYLFGFENDRSFSAIFQQWIYISFIVLIGLFVKYFVVFLMGSLFKMNVFIANHFYDYISLSKIFFATVLIIISILTLNSITIDDELKEYLRFAFILFCIARVQYLYLKSLSVTSYRFIHLFSYLCTTEILPFFIMVKSI